MENTSHTSLAKVESQVLEFVKARGKITIREAVDAGIGSYRNLQRVFKSMSMNKLIGVVEEGSRGQKFYIARSR